MSEGKDDVLIERIVAGETLQGSEAQKVLRMVSTEPSWKTWIRIALGHMQIGQYDEACDILKELLDESV